jgi:ABC-type phosphate/phosphonate transport system ATPase subunit
MLTITDLVKKYPTGTSALQGVSLEIVEPRVVAVIGPSGAGKSTLIPRDRFGWTTSRSPASAAASCAGRAAAWA